MFALFLVVRCLFLEERVKGWKEKGRESGANEVLPSGRLGDHQEQALCFPTEVLDIICLTWGWTETPGTDGLAVCVFRQGWSQALSFLS